MPGRLVLAGESELGRVWCTERLVPGGFALADEREPGRVWCAERLVPRRLAPADGTLASHVPHYDYEHLLVTGTAGG